MQKLHLVGFTPEHDGLILSTRKGAKSGGFVVKVDASVLQQLTEVGKQKPAAAASRTNGLRPSHAPRQARPDSSLAPREMQELLRAGWTIEEVAVEAGVDVDWVSRFASPVLAEMRLVLDQARACVFDKPRVGASALALAPSVRRNVAERGVRFTDEDFDAAWRAHQLDDITWVVGFDYLSRGRRQHAEWTVDLETGELAPRNRLGSQLGYVQSARRKVSTAPPPKPKPKGAAKKAVHTPPAAPPPVPRARARKAAAPTRKARATAKPAKKPRAATEASTETRPPDPYRDQLRSRAADPIAVTVPRPTVHVEPRRPPARRAPEAVPEPGPEPEVEVEQARPVAVIGPVVRTLVRRPSSRPSVPPTPPEPEPEPEAEAEPEPALDDDPTPTVGEDLPDLRWSLSGSHGPLPAPEPVPVPERVREKVAAPLGAIEEPGAPDVAVDLRFPRTPTFRGVQAAGAPPPAARRRRRTEPLRGR